MRRALPVLVFVALAASGCGGSSTTGVSAGLGAKGIPAIKPPANVPGPLDGASTPRAHALRRPLAVIIENFAPDSRPQSGLGAASTVIETLAEGGITRFMAIYLEHDAATVGPVRSTRLYFDRWAASFHAILDHAGGNDDAQHLLYFLPSVYNVDEQHTEINLYQTGSPLFWRSGQRTAPHNLYTSTYKVRAAAARRHEDWAYANAYFIHKEPAAVKKRGHSGSLSINWVNPLFPQPEPAYDVRYVFDRASDTYLRYMGGAPHVDADTNRALRPANVVVMKTADAAPDPNAGPTAESIVIPTLGSGKALFFRDGHVLYGTWHQHDQFAPLRFLDGRGQPIALNPGQTWIEVVPASSTLSWSFR